MSSYNYRDLVDNLPCQLPLMIDPVTSIKGVPLQYPNGQQHQALSKPSTPNQTTTAPLDAAIVTSPVQPDERWKVGH